MLAAERPESELLHFLHNTARVQVDGAASDGAYALIELTGPQGDMPPLHVHRAEDEVFYVLEGRLALFVGDRALELGAGECAVAPRGVPHVYRVESDHSRWLALVSPPGFETFVREVAARPGLEPAELTEVAARYGIEILGPPGTLPS